MEEIRRIDEAVHFLRESFGSAPRLTVVAGSGLGGLSEGLALERKMSYQKIPHFAVGSVAGHQGALAVGGWKGFSVAALLGRIHLYEGVAQRETVFAVRSMARWGCPDFILTNAAGGINWSFQAGDLMLIRDHINLQGSNPLVGPGGTLFGERFPDMTTVYDKELRQVAKDQAKRTHIDLKEGVYVGLLGPSFETPAEIQMLRGLGADAVGMSTVAEAIALRQMERRVLGISCITNQAAGMQEGRLTHEEVLEATRTHQGQFQRLLKGIAQSLSEASQ